MIAPGPDYLPARPLDDVQIGSQNTTLWYATDETAVSGALQFAARNQHLFEPLPDVRTEEDALACANEWLQRTTPNWLVGFRDIARSTDERTMLDSVCPFSAVGHKLPLLTGSTGPMAALPALLSSFAFDFALRLKIGGTSLGFFIAKQLPVVRPDMFSEPTRWGTDGRSFYDWLLPRVLELTYVSWELKPFACDCGWDGPPFRWEEERRFLLRCELDAAFFHLYLPADERGDWQPPRPVGGNRINETAEQLAGLTHYFPTPKDAVGYIMDTFPIVRRKDETRFGEYRSKSVVLDIYDAMQTATATGEPYRTRLDPPPADPSCCHPPQIAVVDLVSVAAGEWARPEGDQIGAETAVLAAVLKAVGSPLPARRVRLTALLSMEPRLLTPSLSVDDARHWERLVGPEAAAHESTTARLASYAWGTAVRQLRGTGRLIENLSEGTWAPGSGLDAIRTEGWPDGRVGMVMQTLRRRDPEEIVRTLPENIRDWINVEAA